MEHKFEVNGRQYTTRKLNAFKQFHIVRRIAPLLSEMLPLLQTLVKDRKQFDALTEEQKFEKIAPIVPVVLNGLASLKDEDADHVLHGLLGSVEVQQVAGNWAPVYANGMLMFQDLQLPDLLQIAGHAFMHNLSGFFSALPQ